MAFRIAIVALCAVLLAGGLTTGDLYRNEGLRTRLAAEALAGGGWLVPRLHGEAHLTKPPGMSLLIGLCSLPTGEVTAATARLPSVLAGAAAVALVGWAVGRCYGARAGWLAAAALPCVPLWLDRAPSAEIDLVQLAWVTAALVCFWRTAEAEWRVVSHSHPGATAWWLLALLCVAGGFFTKWTAPAFFYLTALPYLWWRGRLRLLLSPGHLTGVALLVTLALGWASLVVAEVGWPALRDTLGREALLRLSPGHHPRPYPWEELITFPIAFIAGCLPWSLFAAFSLRPGFVRSLDERRFTLWLLAVCWFGPSLLFWTLAPGHRPRHLLPAQPAVVLLAAMVWAPWCGLGDGGVELRPRRLALLATLLVGWLGVKLLFVAFVMPARHRGHSPRVAGELVAEHVPPGEVLHLGRLKDDGLLFYYGRPARRLPDGAQRPAGWHLLTEAEWRCWPVAGAEVELTLRDGQGDPLVLVRQARPSQAAR